MKLKINDSYHISDIAPTDKAAYLEHFKEKQIYDQTLAIPFPYTEADADWWINHNIEATKKQDGRSVNWAIRRSSDDFLIGGIGFLGLTIGESHTAKLGYWLAKPYWKNGIMTAAVKMASEYAFKEFGLTRITASVFHFNIGSARVLEKAGFQCEGHLRSHYKKDGKIFDGKLYAILNEVAEASPTILGMKLNSIIFHTNNLGTVREFYQQVLNLKVGTYEKDGKVIPDCSETYVNFEMIGGTLFCFEHHPSRVDSGTAVIHVADPSKLKESLQKKGLEFQGDNPTWIKIKDPDGRSLIFEQAAK